MDHAPRSHHDAFTPAQVSGFCHDDRDEVILEYFRCRCGAVWNHTRRNSYSNLMQHVKREHSVYESVMVEASTTETGSLLDSTNRLALSIYVRLDFILPNNLVLRAMHMGVHLVAMLPQIN
ncbi:hypothetical protein V7S43_017021 [Phytophthora oleae]|uniref:BED-type domain-containing protein n=1 Tax=Phytophthora oleae TaxID=2107226 RepID=A0ABD3EUJ2_9STRA